MNQYNFNQMRDTLVIPSSPRKTPLVLIGTPIFEHHYVVWHGLEDGYVKDLYIIDWTTCSKYDSHSRLDSQHD